MRACDRDLIRGGHYGQRSREPHQQAEHMAAPTNAALVKKVLANSEPSTHGPKLTSGWRRPMSAFRGKADIAISVQHVRFSNRPFGVKHFQTIRRCGVDVTHGLVLLFGIGTKALPSWDSGTRWNNLS